MRELILTTASAPIFSVPSRSADSASVCDMRDRVTRFTNIHLPANMANSDTEGGINFPFATTPTVTCASTFASRSILMPALTFWEHDMFCEKTGKSLLTDIGGRVVDMFLLNEPMEKSLKAADNWFRQQKMLSRVENGILVRALFTSLEDPRLSSLRLRDGGDIWMLSNTPGMLEPATLNETGPCLHVSQ